MTEFEAESLLSSYSEPDDADHTFDIGTFSFPSDVRVPEFVEPSHYMQSIAVFDSMPQALRYSCSYEDFDAVFQPDGASLEHTNVQQLDAPKFDLEAILELYTFVEPSQLSIPPPIASFNPCSEPDSVTDLFLELFYNEKNSYNLSAPFPNDEPDLVTIYESADIPELIVLYQARILQTQRCVYQRRARFEYHLRACRDCRAELHSPYIHLSAHSEP
ncbi:hypothetical protein B0H10DRAFT_1998765, partial [Mycena sp. CBHHK59/15]